MKGLSEDIECPNGDFNGHKSKSRIIKADESASFSFKSKHRREKNEYSFSCFCLERKHDEQKNLLFFTFSKTGTLSLFADRIKVVYPGDTVTSSLCAKNQDC